MRTKYCLLCVSILIVPTMFFRELEEVSDSGSDNEVGSNPSKNYDASLSTIKIDDGDLPIRLERKKILKAINKNRVTVIVGSTGSGKSTIIPAYLMAQLVGTNTKLKLAISQPRRIAAVRLAERVASFMTQGEDRIVGRAIGYGIRGKQAYDFTNTKICYVTTGYFQRILAYHPDLINQYSHILLDEVHERSIDSDFLCLIVRILLARDINADVRLVIMSATMQASLYRDYFKTINGQLLPHQIKLAAGSQFKVKTHYLEDVAEMIPDGCCATLKDALTQFVVQSNTSATGARAQFSDEVKDVCVQLILKFAQEGHSVLCFLPGHGEMCHVTEVLEGELMRRGENVISVIDDMETYKKTIESFPKHFYEIFSLHGLMPQSQMSQPLGDPPKKCRRIILATNVAESSLTVKGVNVVIDSGLRKITKYDHQDSFSRLVNTWCSRASITQRQGRTGRICDGISIRLFTREWEQRVLADHDAADIAHENFANLFLFAKPLCENWHKQKVWHSPLPSTMLARLPDAPDVTHITAAVETLHKTGLTFGEPTELAPLTILGILTTRLHLDMGVCRLVYYGWIMGIPIEGIVLACSCSIDRDVLRYPTKWASGNEAKFSRDSKNSLAWRELFDAGSMSEPITYRNILLSWICSHTGVQLDPTTHPLPLFDPSAVFSSEFETFRSLCESVAERFETFLREDLGLESDPDIAAFRFILNKHSLGMHDLKQPNNTADCAELLKNQQLARDFVETCPAIVPRLMPASIVELKLLLAISMNRRVIHADATPNWKNENNNALVFKVSQARNDNPISYANLNFRRSAFESLVSGIIGEVPERIDFSPRGDEMIVTLLAPSIQVNPLLIPGAARVAIQFFDRRKTQFRLQNGPFMTHKRPIHDDFILLVRPRLANVVHWNYLSIVNDCEGKAKRSMIHLRLNYRNASGWLLRSKYESEPTDYWAVSPCLSGVSGPTDMYGQSSLTDTRADFATVLPLEFGGSLALIYQLISLPFYDGLEAVISINTTDGNYSVKRVKFEGKWFHVHDMFPITNEILSRASAIRDLLLAGTNIGFDKSGSIKSSVEQLDWVRKLLPGSIGSLFSYVHDFYSSDNWNQTKFGNYVEQIVQLIDHNKSPQIVTDSRVWTIQEHNLEDDPIWLPQDKPDVGCINVVSRPIVRIDCDDEMITEKRHKLVTNDAEREPPLAHKQIIEPEVSPAHKPVDLSESSTTASPFRLAPVECIRERLKVFGFSEEEVDNHCEARGETRTLTSCTECPVMTTSYMQDFWPKEEPIILPSCAVVDMLKCDAEMRDPFEGLFKYALTRL